MVACDALRRPSGHHLLSNELKLRVGRAVWVSGMATVAPLTQYKVEPGLRSSPRPPLSILHLALDSFLASTLHSLLLPCPLLLFILARYLNGHLLSAPPLHTILSSYSLGAAFSLPLAL